MWRRITQNTVRPIPTLRRVRADTAPIQTPGQTEREVVKKGATKRKKLRGWEICVKGMPTDVSPAETVTPGPNMMDAFSAPNRASQPAHNCAPGHELRNERK